MDPIETTLEQLYSITHIPMYLVGSDGQLIQGHPGYVGAFFNPSGALSLIEGFQRQKRDREHPLISFFDPGFLVGMVQTGPEQYLVLGLVSPYVLARSDILPVATQAVPLSHLQEFCDLVAGQQPMSLEQLQNLICLVARLLGWQVRKEHILFLDKVSAKKLSASALEQTLFQQREETSGHVPVDFEQGICDAIETGNRTLLEQVLFSPHPGHVGRMSFHEQRQLKYSFVCLATLASRAAIRGGLPAETSFSLSDLYCQRADMLTDMDSIKNLVFTMLSDFCGKVRQARQMPAVSSVVQNCLTYISVHLHEDVTLQALSQHVGLCTRSLSLRFRQEVGMGISEYLHRERLQEAEYLLLHTRHTLSEIAQVLHYPSQSYFTQVFKKYLHQTPQQYRDHARR